MVPSFYLSIKLLHISCALISICGFTARSILKLNNSDYLHRRWIKTLPHLNDTILLSCAFYLAIQSRQYPLVDGWLTAKVIGLLLYIGFGMVVMRFGRNRPQQIAGLILAMLSFGYIIAVALTRSPSLGF